MYWGKLEGLRIRGKVMNVYDFDGTIYNGDSTVDFYLYCVRRHPALLKYLPVQGFAVVRYMLRRCDKTRMKEKFYSFLRGLDQVDEEVKGFWTLHKKKIADWYLQKQEDGDVVISASPEFLLKEICRELGIRHLIASHVDSRGGAYEGLNCYGEEKEKRFCAEFGDAQIDEFYTDSKSDLPMARIAARAYIKVRKGFILWKE